MSSESPRLEGVELYYDVFIEVRQDAFEKLQGQYLLDVMTRFKTQKGQVVQLLKVIIAGHISGKLAVKYGMKMTSSCISPVT